MNKSIAVLPRIVIPLDNPEGKEKPTLEDRFDAIRVVHDMDAAVLRKLVLESLSGSAYAPLDFTETEEWEG